MRNEKTSKKVAAIAGKVLRKTQDHSLRARLHDDWDGLICTVADIRTLAASCLTQTSDKKRTPKQK